MKAKQFFHGDLLDQMKTKDTNAEKSEFFLINTIDSSLNVGITSSFVSLLEVMKNFDSPTVLSLAEEIDANLLQLTTDSAQPLSKG